VCGHTDGGDQWLTSAVGEVTSKTAAAGYARAVYGERWRRIVDEAEREPDRQALGAVGVPGDGVGRLFVTAP
jgi:hypothetical protein